jgi:salicylate hydroxylase
MASSSLPIHIAIIGRGIGGLSFAIGLQKYPHISFTIYESHSSFSEIGAGLGFTTNAHRAMSLISPALYEKFKSVALFNGTEEKRGFAFRHQVGDEGPDEGTEIIEVQIPPGTSVDADVVVGCDGLKSVSRPYVFGRKSELSRPRFTGKIAYRAIIPMERAIKAIGEKQAKNR